MRSCPRNVEDFLLIYAILQAFHYNLISWRIHRFWKISTFRPRFFGVIRFDTLIFFVFSFHFAIYTFPCYIELRCKSSLNVDLVASDNHVWTQIWSQIYLVANWGNCRRWHGTFFAWDFSFFSVDFGEFFVFFNVLNQLITVFIRLLECLLHQL